MAAVQGEGLHTAVHDKLRAVAVNSQVVDLIQQYGKARNILVAGYVNKGESAEEAVRLLHTAFGLDGAKVFEETQLSAEELAAKANKGR